MGSSEDSSEGGLASRRTHVVLGRIQLLTSCSTEDISSLLAVGPRPPSVPCFMGLLQGSSRRGGQLPAEQASEEAREAQPDRTRVFLEAAFHSHQPDWGGPAFSSVPGGKGEGPGATTSPCAMLTEAGGNRQLVSFSPQVRAAAKNGGQVVGQEV